jgi:hypothetical protein
MISAKPVKGGKVLVEIDGAASLIEADDAMALASQLAGAAMSVALYSNAVLLRNVEDAKLCRAAYTP